MALIFSSLPFWDVLSTSSETIYCGILATSIATLLAGAIIRRRRSPHDAPDLVQVTSFLAMGAGVAAVVCTALFSEQEEPTPEGWVHRVLLLTWVALGRILYAFEPYYLQCACLIGPVASEWLRVVLAYLATDGHDDWLHEALLATDALIAVLQTVAFAGAVGWSRLMVSEMYPVFAQLGDDEFDSATAETASHSGSVADEGCSLWGYSTFDGVKHDDNGDDSVGDTLKKRQRDTFGHLQRSLRQNWSGRPTDVDPATQIACLLPLHRQLKVETAAEEVRLAQQLLHRTRRGRQNVLRSLWNRWKVELLLLALARLCFDALSLAPALLIRLLVDNLTAASSLRGSATAPPSPAGKRSAATPREALALIHGMIDGRLQSSVVLLGVLVSCSVVGSFLRVHYNLKLRKIVLYNHGLLSDTIYQVAVSRRKYALGGKSQGDIINYLAVDAQRVAECVQCINDLWALPLQVALALYMLYLQLSFAFFTGLGLTVLLVPINVGLSKRMQHVQTHLLRHNDERVLTINEIIKNAAYIKMCGWASGVAAWVRLPRENYMKYLKWLKYLDACCVVFWVVTPVLVSVATFSAFIALGGELTPGRAIASVALFGALILPLNAYPWVVNGVIEARVSLARLQPFLCAEEQDPETHLEVPHGSTSRGHMQRKVRRLCGAPAALGRAIASRIQRGSAGKGAMGQFQYDVEELPETDNDAGSEAEGVHSRPWPPRRDLLASPITAPCGVGRVREGTKPRSAAPGMGQHAYRRHLEGPSESSAEASGSDRKDCLVHLQQCCVVYQPLKDAIVTSRAPSLVCATEITNDLSVLPDLHVFSLHVPHFKASRGQLVAITGGAGGGKSTLLDAIADECRIVLAERNHVQRESMSYVEQVPFIATGTVKHNILFGKMFQEQRYNAALQAACLDEEVRQMTQGDSTYVGDHGSHLSGGQKYRIALARACFANKDLYLFDEGLGALDVTVAHHIITNIFVALARAGKCVLVATHNEELIRQADVVYECSDGKVSLVGRHNQHPLQHPPHTDASASLAPESLVMSGASVGTTGAAATGILREGSFQQAELMHPVARSAAAGGGRRTQCDKTERSCTVTEPTPEESAFSDSSTPLEASQHGHLSWRTVHTYVAKVGWLMVLAVVALATTMQASRNYGDWYVAQWSGREGQRPQAGPSAAPPSTAATKELLRVLQILAAANGALALARGFTFAVAGLRASRQMHEDLLCAVLHASYSFFSITPSGQIINRLSRDVYNVDDSLPFMGNIFLAQSLMLLGSLVVIVSTSSYFLLLAIVPLVAVYYTAQRPYRRVSRDVKRLESVARAPMIDNLRDCIDGGVLMRSLGSDVVCGFLRVARADLSVFLRTQYNAVVLQAWFALRLELLGVFVLTIVGAVTLFYHGSDQNVALLGLSLAYVPPLTSYISGMLSSFTDTEKLLVSVERIREYLDLPSELQLLTSGELRVAADPGAPAASGVGESSRGGGPYASVKRPHFVSRTSVWPLFGTVEFKDVSLRYDPACPLVLRNLSFRVEAGEKIGIVGRTGAGKTSIFSALLKLVALQRGAVYIDGVDTRSIPPDELRQRLSVLPQRPFTFHGTVRHNVDPFNKHTDDEIAFALHCVNLHHLSPTYVVSEGGGNLSGAERHMLALARTVLQQSCIMLLDEPTSQVNELTESTLWNVMGTHFRESTIICITHKTSKVDFFDRLIVLDKGAIVAQGTPDELRRDRVWPFHAR